MKCIKKRILILLSFVLPLLLSAQDLWSVRMAQSVMHRHPNIYQGWDYVTGTVLRGFEELWKASGDQQYYNYIKSTVDFAMTDAGNIRGYNLSAYNIDQINEGRMVLFLYKETVEQKYKAAADLLRSQLETHPRTNEGGFWHKDRYPWQMWLDGLYMGSPFYADYSALFNDPDGLDDVVLQQVLMEKNARDSTTGLLYHGYDESREQFWADPVTGRSASFWGRAIGWYAMALVDVLDFLPQEHTGRDTVIAIFNRLVEGMVNFQDESGVWWQVVDKGGQQDNYIESSVSSMMVYAMARGIRLGYISQSYLPDVIKGYNGILNEFITVNPDSTINLTKICLTAGLGGSRDGSYNYYVNQTEVVENDGKGVGPFITGSVEIERLSLPQNFTATALSESQIQLSWTNPQGNFEGYQVLRSSGSGFEEIARITFDDTTFTDSGLDSLTIYQYRLRPYVGSDYSIFSPIVKVSTLASGGRPAWVLNPFPADSAVIADMDIELSWQAAGGAESYDIYFGESNPPAFAANISATSYNPGTLKQNTDYFWRVDGVNSAGTSQGSLWTFSIKEAESIIAHWPMDEGLGITLEDIVGNNNATITNAVMDYWQKQDGITFISLDGVDDYAVVAHNEKLNFGNGSFSISFWVRQSVQDRNMRYIIKGTHTAPGSGKRYEVFHHQNNEVRFAIDDNLTKSSLIVPNTNFVTGDWVHVVAIRDTENDELRIYANTILQGFEFDNTGDISQDEDLYFGESSDEEDNNLAGSLDDMRLYNYAISDSLIQSLYNQRITALSANLVDLQPDGFALSVYPNPFNSTTRLQYNLPQKGNVTIEIYNVAGQLMTTLIKKQQNPGNYTVNWYADNFPSGLYLCRINAGNVAEHKKIILIK